MPVSYSPNWVPSGFKSDPSSKNRFINSAKRKEFSIFINLPRNSSLPDGEYKRENFVLLKKTYIHNNRAHSIAVFGDIDIDSGKKILNSIQIN
jgi:negative regulator of sigma E activity